MHRMAGGSPRNPAVQAADAFLHHVVPVSPG